MTLVIKSLYIKMTLNINIKVIAMTINMVFTKSNIHNCVSDMRHYLLSHTIIEMIIPSMKYSFKGDFLLTFSTRDKILTGHLYLT